MPPFNKWLFGHFAGEAFALYCMGFFGSPWFHEGCILALSAVLVF